MLVRHVVVMLVAALGGANAAALPMESVPLLGHDPGLPVAPDAPGLPVEALDMVDVPDADLAGAVDVTTVLSCRPAVALPLSVWFGTIVEHRERQADFLVSKDIPLGTVMETVPVYEVVRNVVWQPPAALSFLPAVVETEKVLVGTQDVERVLSRQVDVAVSAAWTESRIEWTHEERVVLLSLAAGASFGAKGTLTTACAGETVYSQLPTVKADGHDLFHVDLLHHDHEDGWYTEVLSMDLRLADADDLASLPDWSHKGWLIGPHGRLTGLHDAVEAFDPEGGAAEEEAPAPATSGAPAAHGAPAATSPFAAIIAGAAAALAALGALARRR